MNPACESVEYSDRPRRRTTTEAVPADSALSPILDIKNLQVSFFMERGTVRAVRGVDLTLHRQKTLGLVGESGCGKSVTAMAIMRLIRTPPGRIVSGEMLLQRKDKPRWIWPGWIRRARDALDPWR